MSGAAVVAGGDFRALRVWETASGKPLLTLSGHTGTVRRCVLGTGGLVISGGDDGWARAWDLALGREVASLPLPGAVTCLAAHPARPLIMAGESGGTIVVAEVIRS
jgi:WD40 repeat protein